MNKIIVVLGSTVGLVTIIIILIIAFRNQTSNSEIYTVLDVEKNLTLNISDGREQHKIELCGVDIAKSNQSEAKKVIINELEPVDNIVSVVLKRNKAEVFLAVNSKQEKMLSEELLMKGLGKFIPQDNCPNYDSLKTAEEMAKQNRVGVWK